MGGQVIMKIVEVMSNDLGNCWSAERVLNRCYKCSRYDTSYMGRNGAHSIQCIDRIENTEYNAVVLMINEVRAELCLWEEWRDNI